MRTALTSLLAWTTLLTVAGCTTPEGPLERTGRTVDKIGRNTARSLETGAAATGRTLKKGGERLGQAFE